MSSCSWIETAEEEEDLSFQTFAPSDEFGMMESFGNQTFPSVGSTRETFHVRIAS